MNKQVAPCYTRKAALLKLHQRVSTPTHYHAIFVPQHQTGPLPSKDKRLTSPKPIEVHLLPLLLTMKPLPQTDVGNTTSLTIRWRLELKGYRTELLNPFLVAPRILPLRVVVGRSDCVLALYHDFPDKCGINSPTSEEWKP